MVTVSIVLYNHCPHEIKSVLSQVLKVAFGRIYIIDNSPNDLLREVVYKISSDIVYINGQGNIGYGAAHNIAIKKSLELGADYHLVLNPDVSFSSDVIWDLKNYMDKHSDIGLIMPNVLYSNGEIQYLCKLLPTPIDLLLRRFLPFKSLLEKRNFRYELHFSGYKEVMDVPSLSGCFMFLRSSVLKQIGGFDERYFMYAEDVDLCRRVGMVSRTVFYPYKAIVHEYGKGSYRHFRLLKYHVVSIIKYFNKWGWFFDDYRKVVNKKILEQYKKK